MYTFPEPLEPIRAARIHSMVLVVALEVAFVGAPAPTSVYWTSLSSSSLPRRRRPLPAAQPFFPHARRLGVPQVSQQPQRTASN